MAPTTSTSIRSVATSADPTSRPTEDRRQMLVYGGMTAVAVAAGMAAHLHGGLPTPIAAVVGLAVLVAVVSVHLLAGGAGQRSQRAVATAAIGQPRQSQASVEAGTRQTSEGAEPRHEPKLSIEPVARHAGVHAAELPPSQVSPELIAGLVRELSIERGSDQQMPSQVHGGSGLRSQSAPTTTGMAAGEHPSASLVWPQLSPAPQQRAVQPPPLPSEDVITRSVHALRGASDVMRASSGLEFVGALEPRSAPAAVLAEIADAIEGDRLTVTVAPVLALNAGQAICHEVAVGLQLRSGEAVIPDDLVAVAGGTPLMALLEALVVARAVNVGRTLAARQPGSAALVRVSVTALDNRRVVTALGGEDGQPRAATEPVVLAFDAVELKQLTQAQWSRLADLADLGYRFAIDRLGDLDLELELLCNVGFAFARIEARLLLDGLSVAGRYVAPAETALALHQLGLRTIVTGVDDASVLSRVSALAVDFGMGRIFGRDEVGRPAKFATGSATEFAA